MPQAPGLSRILDIDLRAVTPPPRGLLISERVAHVLDLRVGDRPEVELLEYGRRIVRVPVTGIVQSYVGLAVYMDHAALDRLAGDGPRISAVQVAVDAAAWPALFGAVKETPAIAAIALKNVSRTKFRETIGQNIGVMMTVYVGLASIITFGVAYNSARIQFSERARELASLRVLGFTRLEVSSVLMIELALIVIAAQPLGWLLGYGFAATVTETMSSDLFRIPFIIKPETYALSSLVVMSVAALTVFVVRRRVDGLDMVRVLKTRE
jgi:putative ABC transport system permease protein